MKNESIPYLQTNHFSKIVTDYLKGDELIKPFYHYSPELNTFQQVIDQKSFKKSDRDQLTDLLIAQYKSVECNAIVTSNIESFRNENTFCVVTAHQLNIFTGPLFVIYKTISAIKLCIQLKQKYPTYQFVPVFWLGSEDHDFEEINHIKLFNKTLTWDHFQGGACGQYQTDTMSSLLEELKGVLGENENAQYLNNVFSKAYESKQNLANATRILLNALFGEFGLIVIDSDDKILKSSCADLIEEELLHRRAEKVVTETLDRFPYEAQATPRSINLFYSKDKIRERIIFNDEEQRFEVLNTTLYFNRDEILSELKEHPEFFSPNVILRPLFQQKVLPSLAYVGGGGEIAYWLQLRDLFSHFLIQFPVLLLRDSFLLIDASTEKKILKFDINFKQLFEDENNIIQKYVLKNSEQVLSLQSEKDTIKDLMDKILTASKKIDSSLEKTVLAERQNMLNALEKLEQKFVKAEKTKMETELNQIRSIFQKLFPGGNLQERHDNFIPYYLKYGKNLFEFLLSHSDPFDGTFKVVWPEIPESPIN